MVAARLMTMSGSAPSTSALECDRVAASPMNEVVTTIVPVGVASPMSRTRNLPYPIKPISPDPSHVGHRSIR